MSATVLPPVVGSANSGAGRAYWSEVIDASLARMPARAPRIAAVAAILRATHMTTGIASVTHR